MKFTRQGIILACLVIIGGALLSIDLFSGQSRLAPVVLGLFAAGAIGRCVAPSTPGTDEVVTSAVSVAATAGLERRRTRPAAQAQVAQASGQERRGAAADALLYGADEVVESLVHWGRDAVLARAMSERQRDLGAFSTGEAGIRLERAVRLFDDFMDDGARRTPYGVAIDGLLAYGEDGFSLAGTGDAGGLDEPPAARRAAPVQVRAPRDSMLAGAMRTNGGHTLAQVAGT